MGDVYDIDEIVIWNRVDECCWNRLQNFYVMVSETPITSDSTEKNAFSGPSSFSSNFPNVRIVKSGKGKYVRIFTNNGTIGAQFGGSAGIRKPAAGASAAKLYSELKSFSGHGSEVSSVAFSPNGKTLASGSWDKTIKLWDIAAGKELKTFSGHSDQVYSVAFSPDGKTIASGSRDKTIKLWNIATGQELKTFSGHNYEVSSIAFSPDGKTVASGSWDKTIKLWDIAAGKEVKTFSGHGNEIS